MNKTRVFDVLVVYSQGIATSTYHRTSKDSPPFSASCDRANYNATYAYFLETCARHDLTAAFTTSADITGPGSCRCFWLFEDDSWKRIDQPGYAPLIFDKFAPINKGRAARRKLLFSQPQVKPFNNRFVFDLFFDKQKTYEQLSDFALPTVTIKSPSRASIKKAMSALKAMVALHPNREDFSIEFVMKDRFGSGGNNVYRMGPDSLEEMRLIMQKNPHVSFVLQPFTKFDQGFRYKDSFRFTDIRLIFMGGNIIQTYIRMAKEKDFRCNEHLGGTLVYLAKKHIPQAVVKMAWDIAGLINRKQALFALDFIITNRKTIYLLEGNSGPGLDWNPALAKNERMAKRLIQLIVKELVRRVGKVTPSRIIVPEVVELPLPLTPEFAVL
jgi:glutathione synthase/RimK-type ligase-like ATP-grasp enzyme